MIKKLFKNNYINKNAVKHNFIMLLLYNLAYPTSLVFARLSIKPNVITSLSALFALIALVFLIQAQGYLLFIIFWLTAIHLDFCDGTVARISGNISKSAFNYDHVSDLIKVSLILLGAGIRYNTPVLWILSFTSLMLFLLMTILNHELGYHISSQDVDIGKINISGRDNGYKSKYEKLIHMPILRQFITIIFTVNAHTLLGFIVLPFGQLYAIYFLFYFCFINLYLCMRITKKLIRIQIN